MIGGDFVRKVLSIIISLFIGILPLGVISVAFNNETDKLSLEEFTADFVDFMNTDNIYNEISDFSSRKNASVFNSENNVQNEESLNFTNRLIVKSTSVLNPLDSVDYIYGYDDYHFIQFDNHQSTLKAIEYYSALSCVEFVEEDAYLSEAVVDDGNEMIFESAAGYPTAVQSGIFGYTSAKAESDGYDVKIAVIDSGVEINHDFLKGRVVDSGVDVINNSGTANDDRGHGTHVAGIIVSNTLSNVSVHAYKALNSSGSGTVSQISLAIDAAIEDEVDIINLSMSMKGSSNALRSSVKKAYNAGIAVIVAAGNNRSDLTYSSYSPASFDECITVMSCSNTRNILDTSNYGTPCDYAAPGENILSTYINNTFKLSTGTSMAAPFICAAAAYLLAKDNTLTPEQIRTALGENYEWCFGEITGKCVIPSTKLVIDGFAETPEFVTLSGEFIGKMYVELLDSDKYDIFYYLNNNASSYIHYTKPFVITETTKVTAFIVQGGKVNSSTNTQTFTKIDVSNIADYVVSDNILVSYNGTSSSVNIPVSIDGENVYKIGANAFKDNKNITSLTLCTSVTEIGEGALSGCENLSKVSAPNVSLVGSGAFSDCKKLSDLTIGKLKRVEDFTFKNCSSLQEFDFSEVEFVGEGAFLNTTALKEFNAPFINTIESNAFESSGVSSITLGYAQVIGDYAFSNCDNIISVIINNYVIDGVGVFKNCDKLTDVYAPDFKSVPDYFFEGCTVLNNYDFSQVKEVGVNSFKGCTALESFSFPALTTVKDYSFASSGINSIVSDTLKNLTSTSFYDCNNVLLISLGGLKKVDFSYFSYLENEISLNFENATEIIFPENGMSACYPKVTSFTANKITSLPAGLFSGCTSLTECSLNNVTAIGDNTFYGCTSLNILKLPSLTSAGNNVFSNSGVHYLYCRELSDITYDTFNGMKSVMDLYIGINSISDIEHLKFSVANNVGLDNIVTLPDTFSIYDMFPSVVYFSAAKLENVPDYCFARKTGFGLNKVNLPGVKTIGEGAFEHCMWFSDTTTVFYAEEIGLNAFNGIAFKELSLVNLKKIDCDIFGSSAEKISVLNLPSLESIENFSFSDFPVLSELNLDSVTEIQSDTFQDFTSIKKLSLNSIEYAPENAFLNMSSLESFSATSLKEVGKNAFLNDLKLNTVTLGSVQKIGESAFEGCSVLKTVNNGNTPVELGYRAFYNCVNLNLLNNSIRFSVIGSYSMGNTLTSADVFYDRDIIRVEENGFAGVQIPLLYLENVQYLYGVPEGNGFEVFVGSNVTDCKLTKSTFSTVVTRPGTYLADYCINNNVRYKELNEKNTIVTDVQPYITEETSLYFEARGFNLRYKWYGCNNADKSDSVILLQDEQPLYINKLGTGIGKFKYYYCIAESSENGNVVNITSTTIINLPILMKSTSSRTTIDYAIQEIWTESLSSQDFINNLKIDGDYTITPSYKYGDIESYGTGTAIDLLMDDGSSFTYNVIMLGDVNGDGYVNVLDVSLVGDATNGFVELEGDYHIAASYLDSRAGLSVTDYQAVVNKSLS